MEGLRSRTWLAVLGVVAAVIFVVPNFMDVSRFSFWPSGKLNYGLDIQGGLHLVMGVDVDGVVATSVHRQTQVLKSELAKENVTVKEFNTAKGKEGQFSVVVSSADEVKKVEDLLKKKLSNHASGTFDKCRQR